LLFVNLAWLFSTYILKTYSLYRIVGYEKVVGDLFKLFFLLMLIIEAFIGITEAFFYPRIFLVLFYASLVVSVLAWRLGFITLLKAYRKSGYNYRNIVIAGISESTIELKEFFDLKPEHGYRFLGFFSDKENEPVPVKGRISDIYSFAPANNVDEIYCSLSCLDKDEITEMIEFADNNLMHIKLVPDTKGYSNLKIDFYDNLPVLIFRSIQMDEFLNRALKRSFDIVFSLLVIVLVLSWLLPLLAFLIRIDSKGPVFFKQKRSGKDNEDFLCWKLRSMCVNGDSDLKQAEKNDTRITRIGKYLRQYNLDELPQFFNVLIGDMSIIGPRPHMLKHTEDYSKTINKFMVRHFIKPGITGLSQVKGYRGETKDPEMMRRRVQVDIFYIENWSFLLDMKILFLTVFNMLRGEENAF
jgi:putative colanic acid biosysnthesis UDP-glucose lipid carrier transferase